MTKPVSLANLPSFETLIKTTCVCGCSLNSHTHILPGKSVTGQPLYIINTCGNCGCDQFTDKETTDVRILDCINCGYPYSTTLTSVNYESNLCSRCYM